MQYCRADFEGNGAGSAYGYTTSQMTFGSTSTGWRYTATEIWAKND